MAGRRRPPRTGAQPTNRWADRRGRNIKCKRQSLGNPFNAASNRLLISVTTPWVFSQDLVYFNSTFIFLGFVIVPSWVLNFYRVATLLLMLTKASPNTCVQVRPSVFVTVRMNPSLFVCVCQSMCLSICFSVPVCLLSASAPWNDLQHQADEGNRISGIHTHAHTYIHIYLYYSCVYE